MSLLHERSLKLDLDFLPTHSSKISNLEKEELHMRKKVADYLI